MRALREWFEYAGYVVVSAGLRQLPMRAAHALARGLARLFVRLDTGRMRSTRINLQVAFPDWTDARREAVARASVEHAALNLVDFARSEAWDERELLEHVDLVGIEHYEKARERGRGLFILGAHMGNIELCVRRVSLAGVEQLVIGKPMGNARLYARLQSSRERHGAELVDRDDAAVRMLRRLRKGGVVSVLNDHYGHRSRVLLVPFFGVRASTYAGVGMLAVRTGAAICPTYVIRDGEDHHTAHILPEVEFERSGDRERDTEAATLACNAAYEQIIRAHPEQWMWAHRRFKRSPDLPPDLYRAGPPS